MLLVLCPAAPLTSEQAESAGVARPEMKLSRGAWVPELRTEHLPSDDSERGAGGRANFWEWIQRSYSPKCLAQIGNPPLPGTTERADEGLCLVYPWCTLIR